MRYNLAMRPRIFILWFLLCLSAASMPIAPVRASWNNIGDYTTADFYNAHLGLVATDGQHALVQRVVDGTLTGVFATSVSQIAIQDSDRAWATDGDSLYLGTNQWSSWQTVLGHEDLTLVRATPSGLFVYSDSDLYATVGDTMLVKVKGIPHGDSITAMDYLSPLILIAVSSTNGYLSTDGGASWALVKSKMKGVASVFADTAHHLVFTGGDNLRVSPDSGISWNVVVPPEEFGIANFLGQVFGSRDCSGTFYISNVTNNGTVANLFRSQDDGITFENVSAASFPPIIKGWAFDRGSTVVLGYSVDLDELAYSISYNGGDGLIPDSVGTALKVAADTIYDTICKVSSEPFAVFVSSSICTGVRIDGISVVKSKGAILTNITPQTLFGNEARFLLSYAGINPGADSIVLSLSFHSLEWGFPEHIDFPVIAFSTSPPAVLASTDSLQFGDVTVRTSKRLSLQIANHGCAVLRVDSLVSSNPVIFALPQLSFPLSVSGHDSINIPVTYSPASVGPSLESIELGTSAGHTFIELEGRGTEAAAVLEDGDPSSGVFGVFPNPGSSAITINGVERGVNFEILDLLGRTALRGIWDGESITTSSLPDGMYFLKCCGMAERVIISRK